MKNRPHVTRRGKLKNGNPSGDLSKARPCGPKHVLVAPVVRPPCQTADAAYRRPEYRTENSGRARAKS